MATIQVAMRCRPFTIEDRLGVELLQTSDDPPTSECNLLNHDSVSGNRARFAFSYSWWSAFNYKRKLKGEEDMAIADNMQMMSQPAVYESVGKRIKTDLLAGNAVVMFAYGLSGSGKTFTVFGPDAIDSPDAWFKQAQPHDLWGILPNMAYEIFQEKQDDWKITMKYFQNVVDIVRDLMSPNAQEKMYKDGMKKDEDGFTDVVWCNSKVLHTWNDFRNEFMSANARKAISPTQFNHQSTRGHCIMTLEVEKPDVSNPGRKMRGRLYVCDLAGTEPAGDIFYAQYKTSTDGDGNKEYNLVGPHPDQSKTKELQDQGKKINLSLSEMAQFFMKMAEGVVKGTLKPGSSIPGCNTYFLCKYLKDTLLQAKTYLFCAVRPEVTYHKYTLATLGFAKNASVIKVQPKKATTAATPGEKKLMAELEALKAAMEQMQAQNKELESKGGNGDSALLKELQEKNQELQVALQEEQEDGKDFSAEDVEKAVAKKLAELQSMQEKSVISGSQETDEQLKEKYARNGIALSKFDGDTNLPHFTNLDAERFKNGVFMFILSKPEMTFGPKGDFRPQSLAVVPDHCTVTLAEDGTVAVMAGKGRTFVNGVLLKKDETRVMQAFDRLAVESELLLLRMPGREPSEEPPPVEQAVDEYREALVIAAGGSRQIEGEVQEEGGGSKKFEWTEAESKRIDALLAELHPKMQQAKELCLMIDPKIPLDFSLTLIHSGLMSHSQKQSTDVGIKVDNVSSATSTVLPANDFNQCFSLINDEFNHMRDAVQFGGEHTVTPLNRPVVRFFDRMTHSGSCMIFTEFMQFNLESDPDEKLSKILNVSTAGSDKVTGGQLECVWTPLAGPDDDGSGTVEEIDDPQALLGKPWTYRFTIKTATDLPKNVSDTYIEYNFFGERITTLTKEYEKGTRSPDYEFEHVHHISKVTQEFLDFLKSELELRIYTTPYVYMPPEGISTSDAGVAERVMKDPDAGEELSLGRARTSMLEEGATTSLSPAAVELAAIGKQLAKLKMEKRLLVAKSIVEDMKRYAAGSGRKAAQAMNGKISDEVTILRERVAELEAELVARGPVPPSAPHTGNPRSGGTRSVAEVEKELAASKEREAKLCQQIRELGGVPLD